MYHTQKKMNAMRPIRNWLFVLTVALAAGCRTTEPYRIGVSQCSSDDWREKMNEEIRRDGLFHNNIQIEIRSADDDNDRQIADLRTLVGGLLRDRDVVLQASNGKTGIRLASKYTPDLIICDVMMHDLDGLEVCRRLKSEIATSHIPIMMLTACSLDEQRTESYECGADAYLSKPFDSRMFVARCESLLLNRRRLREAFASETLLPHRTGPRTSGAAEARRSEINNDFYRRFAALAERDITNMVCQYRNHPSVVIWSIGNEVPSQVSPEGIRELLMLQNLVHALDPTRPVTCGMNLLGSVKNGFAATLDIPGFNYKPQYYDQAYETLPQKLILGTETASTVSSRGVYYFPVEHKEKAMIYHRPENQSSSYDVEAATWSNLPDFDFAMDDDKEYRIGQFVWTGFDYLGEPTPYDTNA